MFGWLSPLTNGGPVDGLGTQRSWTAFGDQSERPACRPAYRHSARTS